VSTKLWPDLLQHRIFSEAAALSTYLFAIAAMV